MGAYLRQRWRLLVLLMACGSIFAGTNALYGIPLRVVAYPMGLCLLLLLIAGAVDALRLMRRRRVLAGLRDMAFLMADELPVPEGAIEAEYQQLLRLLTGEHRRTESEQQSRYQDMMDYYTIWAHQVKTPIAAMRLHLQQEDSPLSRTLTTELLRVEQYVNMVLAYLRLDAGATDYVIREYDVDAIVRQAVKRFAGEFIARRLALHYEPLNAKVITDEKWLLFVVEQVLSNALKYTAAGSVSIYMEAPRTLCIRDTGMGIAPEDLPRVFEKGFTGAAGRADKKASGIGLYLCRRICRNLGHGIAVESVPGVGTTVRICLVQRRLTVE